VSLGSCTVSAHALVVTTSAKVHNVTVWECIKKCP
jgi:hypothetical protein